MLFPSLTEIILKTSKHLDWLSITLPANRKWQSFIPFAELTLIGKGRHGYGQMWHESRTGATIETASYRDDMGTHLTLSGDVLAALRDDLGATDDTIVERLRQWDGKCSRIDLAIDIFGSTCTPRELNAALLGRTATLPARTWRFIDGHAAGVNGSTIDTGSPTSDRRFRFYDKRAEMRIKDGDAWVRLELQLRRLYARSTVGACAQFGCLPVISATIGEYLTWSNIDYQSAIANGGLIFAPTKRKVSNRQKWLLGQVASALASECLVDKYFRERFNQAVNYFIDEKRKS